MAFITHRQKAYFSKMRTEILSLNSTYILVIGGKSFTVKFIKITPKGYNFLDKDTGKCVMYPHLYLSKKAKESKTGLLEFWIMNNINLEKLN